MRWKVELDVEPNVVGGEIVVEADSVADAEQMVADEKINLADVHHDGESTDPGVQGVYPTGVTELDD